MAGYWPSSYFARLWTETKWRSIDSQSENEGNMYTRFSRKRFLRYPVGSLEWER